MGPNAQRLLALVSLLGCLLLALHAFILGIHFEATPRAIEDSAKGQAIAWFAVPGAVAAGLGLAGGGRRWGAVATVIAALLCVAALMTDVVR